MKKNFSTDIKRSVTIWVSTCVIASVFHWANQTTGHGVDKVILISLFCSAPAMVLLIPNFYILKNHISYRLRLPFGFLSVLLASVMVAGVFQYLMRRFPVDQMTLIRFLSPYIIAAEVSFFIVARKLFHPESPVPNNSKQNSCK